MNITNPRAAKYTTRMGWYKHYTVRFNKTQDPAAANMACWYLLLALEAGETR